MRIACRIALSLVLAILSSHAFGFSRGGNAGPRAQIMVGGPDAVPVNFTNILKVRIIGTNGAPADGGKLDSQGYFTSAPGSDVSVTALTSPDTTWTNVSYSWIITGTRKVPISFNAGVTSCSNIVDGTYTGTVTITGCAGGATTFQPTTACPCRVNFTGLASGSSFTMSFPASGTYASGTGEMVLGRSANVGRGGLSDVDAYITNGKYFTKEFVDALIALKPVSIRYTNWIITGGSGYSNHVKWAYRQKLDDVAWFTNKIPPTAWAGAITGTDTYTSPAATDTPLGGWTANEVIVGDVTGGTSTNITISGAVASDGSHCASAAAGKVCLTVNATATLSPAQQVWVLNVGGTTEANGTPTILTVDDATHFAIDVPFVHAYTSGGDVGTQTLTVTGKSGGAKFMGNLCGQPFSTTCSGKPTVNQLLSCFYDGVLDKVLCASNRGIQYVVPIEAMVQLANDVGAGLWPNIPATAENDYITQHATAMLSLTGNAYIEYGNEVWNGSYANTAWASQRGTTFGWPTASNRAVGGWYGLRVAEISSLYGAVFTGSNAARLKRVLAYQIGDANANILTYRMQGTDISTSVGNSAYCIYTGGTWSGSCTGGASYNSAPNRPGDLVEVFATAPYLGGTNLCAGVDVGSCSPTSANTAWYQALLNFYDSGNTAAALAMVDADLNGLTQLSVQTVTCSGTTCTTPNAHGFTAGSTRVVFTGSLYSGFAAGTLYRVSTTPLTTTFTVQAFTNGESGGSAINAGSAGSGTMSVGKNDTPNFLRTASTGHMSAEYFASQFDSARGAKAPIENRWYEGMLEALGATTTQLSGLSVTCVVNVGDCGTEVQTIVNAWASSPLAKATIQTYYRQFFGQDSSVPTYHAMPHSKGVTQNGFLFGPMVRATANYYTIFSGAGPTSTPYQTFCGIQQFNGGTGGGC